MGFGLKMCLFFPPVRLGAGPGVTGTGGVPGAGRLYPGVGGEIQMCAVG